jgi:hypothetical protein
MELHRTLATLLVVGLLVTAGCAGPSGPSEGTPTEQANVPAEDTATPGNVSTPESTPTSMVEDTPTEGMTTETPTEGMTTETETAGIGTDTPENDTVTPTTAGTS